MDLAGLEGTAALILREAGEDGYEAPCLRAIIATVNGARVQFSRDLRGPAAIEERPEGWFLFVRHQLPYLRQRFFMAHEVAEYWLEREGYNGPDIEHAANLVAAATLAPKAAFLEALRVGMSTAEIAEEFDITESHVVLREAELTGIPRALVTPHMVYIRGEGIWHGEESIRAEGKRPGPGIVKTYLTDEPKRFTLDQLEPLEPLYREG